MSDPPDTRVCSEGQWPRLDMGLAVARIGRPQRSARRPSVACRGLSSHRMNREAAALETAKRQLMIPIGNATPKVKSEYLSDDDDSLQKQIRTAVQQAIQVNEARSGKQWRKGQRRRRKMRLGRDLHDASPARPRDRARQFPRHQSGWPMFLALMSSFSRERVYEICERGDRHSSFPSHFKAASDPDASQLAPSCAL